MPTKTARADRHGCSRLESCSLSASSFPLFPMARVRRPPGYALGACPRFREISHLTDIFGIGLLGLIAGDDLVGPKWRKRDFQTCRAECLRMCVANTACRRSWACSSDSRHRADDQLFQALHWSRWCSGGIIPQKSRSGRGRAAGARAGGSGVRSSSEMEGMPRM